MYSPKIDDVEFKGAEGKSRLLGRVSFLLNRCIQYRRLPVHRSGNGIQIQFPAAAPCPLPSYVEKAIEREVCAAIDFDGVAY